MVHRLFWLPRLVKLVRAFRAPRALIALLTSRLLRAPRTLIALGLFRVLRAAVVAVGGAVVAAVSSVIRSLSY